MASINEIRQVALSDIRPYERNAKIHGQEQIDKLKESIKEFGFVNPCLIDRDYNLIAGHGRVMAAEQLGMESVPCVFIEGLTDEQRRAYILADNKLAELAEWDTAMLASELAELEQVGFDVSLTGFELGETEVEDEPDNTYVKNIDIPHYTPSDEPVSILDCYDMTKHDELLMRIMETDGLSKDEAQFLINSASRHIVFNYKRIADYYASASSEMQRLMEDSALVIIDVNDAIANGYAKLQSYLDEIEERERGEE